MVQSRILEKKPGMELSSVGSLVANFAESITPFRTSFEGQTMQGELEVYPLRRGMTMWAVDLTVRQDTVFDMENGKSSVGFCLVLSGNSRHTVWTKTRGESTVECRPGQNVLEAYLPEKSHVHLAGGQTHRLVEVKIGFEEMFLLLDEWQVSRSGSLRRLLRNMTGSPVGLSMNLTPVMEAAAYQVINCAVTGPARKLFMESKALEIMAHQLADLSEERTTGPREVPRADFRLLDQAREILAAEYADPPSLIELAHRVGLNEFKLKRGFREAFGITVYGYVRSLRMHKARALLESGDGTVSDAALAVGYSCLGHFSAAFRKEFGILPRDVRKADVRSQSLFSSTRDGQPVNG